MRKETPKPKQQVKRIKAFIRRAEARGYRFDSDFKENYETYSTQKLKALKPAKLYSQTTAISEETGKVITGIERQKEERKLSSLKAKATRLLKKQEAKIKQEYYDYSGYDYSDTADASFTDIVLANIEAKIDAYRDSTTEREAYGAKLLDTVLQQQINLYGREKVARSCEEAPDQAKRYSDAVIFASKQEIKLHNLTEFILLITGTVLSIDDAKQIGDALENDSYEVDDDED